MGVVLRTSACVALALAAVASTASALQLRVRPLSCSDSFSLVIS